MNCKGMLRPAAFENDVRDRLDKPPEHFILTYLVSSLLHDFRRSMNRRGKTTRNGEFPNLHHENNFMCTCIAIMQTALERNGRLALDRRGKHAGRDREGWNPRKPTKTYVRYPRRSGFCEIFELLNNFFQTPLRFPILF